MKKLTRALSAASLALVGMIGAGTVLAQDRPDGRGMGADRAMDWAQFKAHADEGFAKLDVNHDGVIDQSDRLAMRDQMRNRMFDGLDKNHDGSVSRQEFESEHGHDGPPPPPGMGPDGDHHGGDRMDGPRGAGMGAMMMMMRGADTNHDGKITRAEYDASVKMHFAAMDTNHDGQISPAERKAAHDKMRAEMQAHMRERAGNIGGNMGSDMGGMHNGPDHGPDHGAGGDDMPPPAQ